MSLFTVANPTCNVWDVSLFGCILCCKAFLINNTSDSIRREKAEAAQIQK